MSALSLLQICPSPWAHTLGVIQFRHPFQLCQFLMTLCHDEMLGVSRGFMKFNNKPKELSNLGWISYLQRHSGSISHRVACIFICSTGNASARLRVERENLTMLHFHFYICKKPAYRIHSGPFTLWVIFSSLPSPSNPQWCGYEAWSLLKKKKEKLLTVCRALKALM